ncbi:MAG: 16S rRNA pseudouridine(516) synthase RsuA [Gammaproteobacteria bacterium]|nr:16S rRNA pseudouridine(516) synthase RsuA [Gammaproteobacteria bacterium]
MRLDRFLSENTNMSRKEAKRALHRESITVDMQVVKKGDVKIIDQQVHYEGVLVTIRKPVFIMLHKPAGYICSTVDDDGISVLDLLPEEMRHGLHIAGRLDKDTTGLVLITEDGQWSHRVTSPNKECYKTYLVEVELPLEQQLIEQFKAGIQLENENKLTKPAQLEIVTEKTARLKICEGKYHQVKRMFAAVDNRVASLHRESVGPLSIEDSLASGQWRDLTEQEIQYF